MGLDCSITVFILITRRLDLFWMDVYLFQCLLLGSIQKWIILAIIRLIPSYIEFSILTL